MLSIASTTAVHWPTSPAPSPAVAPVAPVTAVAPAQRSSGENRSGMGSGRDQHAHAAANPAPDSAQVQRGPQDKAAPGAQAAPILPRKQSKEDQNKGPSEIQAEAAKNQAQEAKAAEEAKAAQKAQLMEVLPTVWKASAAVVDRALGLERAGGASSIGGAVNSAGPAPALDAGVAAAANRQPPVAGAQPGATADGTPQGAVSPDGQAPFVRGMGEPVAYTEHGTGTWVSPELGQLMSHRA